MIITAFDVLSDMNVLVCMERLLDTRGKNKYAIVIIGCAMYNLMTNISTLQPLREIYLQTPNSTEKTDSSRGAEVAMILALQMAGAISLNAASQTRSEKTRHTQLACFAAVSCIQFIGVVSDVFQSRAAKGTPLYAPEDTSDEPPLRGRWLALSLLILSLLSCCIAGPLYTSVRTKSKADQRRVW